LGSYDPKSDPIEEWYAEYDPRHAYKNSNGKELLSFGAVAEPIAKYSVDPTELSRRYPTLWQRIRQKKQAQQDRSDRGRRFFLEARLDRIVAQGESASLFFSSGAEIRIRGYWPYYRTRYKVEAPAPDYDKHPMLGKTVVSIEAENFPQSFYLWFDNRRKLSLGCESGDCCDFEVIEIGTRIAP
jgi:hypothetical protein